MYIRNSFAIFKMHLTKKYIQRADVTGTIKYIFVHL